MQTYCVMTYNMKKKLTALDFVYADYTLANQRVNYLNRLYIQCNHPKIAYIEERYLVEKR